MDEIRSCEKCRAASGRFRLGRSARAEPVKTEILRQMLDAGFSPQFARDLLPICRAISMPHRRWPGSREVPIEAC
jgi:hypothetical protein